MSGSGALYVKICGITRVEDAEAAIEASASAIGLNFVPSSKRRIDEATARAIIARVKGRIEVVGVVADLSAAEMAALRERTGIEWVQLHGNETPETLRALGPGAFKAARIGEAADVEAARSFPGDRLLVDAKVPGSTGGTGTRFDWSLVGELVRERSVVVAGGLDPENVASLVSALSPFGVDVASGVESAPGVKDQAKVRAFVEAARAAPGGLDGAG